ncbi:LuxR C-terminal-related transcriptional regulator [Actinoallomurus sp. CA-150999]|uniref:helix-turn-helix transcriptional regulator n=1 Tax=Actinoallomurus sp. CA-150999 TaxID=3239887 RepID=UPI003D94906A
MPDYNATVAKARRDRAIADSVRRFQSKLRSDTGAVEIIDHAVGALADVMPTDVWCGVLLDPSTMLDTGGEHTHGFPPEYMSRLFQIEHVEQDDVDNIRALAQRAARVSVLSESTHHDLATSKYYREILEPLRLSDELRVMLRDGDRVWGLLVLCRGEGSRPFDAGDVALAEAVSRPASDALRRSLLLSGLDRGDLPDAPGLIMLDADLRIRSLSDTARHWVDRLQESGSTDDGTCPYAVQALAARACTTTPGTPVRSRAPIGSGRWLTLHAWTVDQGGEPATAISIAPAEARDLTAIILDVYGLSVRERQITQHVLRGNSTNEIARRLHLSPYTVQDHLKSVFDKAGVRSRRELTANLFFRHYFPQLADPPLSTDGRLINGVDG